MIPIRPPATGRAYPGPREPAPSGPVQAADRIPTRRWGSGTAATRLPRAAGHFRALLRGRATVDVRTPHAALSLDPPTEPGVWSLSGEAAVVASGREGAAGLPGFSTVIPLVGTDLAVR